MTRLILDISMSLDGYATAANVRPEEPMGDGGQQLHEWAHGEDERGNAILAESNDRVGATIAGRRTYDLSIPWWGADGPGGAARTPTVVVSHGRPDQLPDGRRLTARGRLTGLNRRAIRPYGRVRRARRGPRRRGAPRPRRPGR